MPPVPEYKDLSESEQAVVNAFNAAGTLMKDFEYERIILFMAFLCDDILSSMADRVLAARQMDAYEMVDMKVHVCGQALANAMGGFREAYDQMYDHEYLAGLKDKMEPSLALVDDLMGDFSPEAVQELLAKLEAMRQAEES